MILINGVLDLFCAGLGLLLVLYGSLLTERWQRTAARRINRAMLITSVIMLGCDGIALCFLHRDPGYDLPFRLLMMISFAAFYSVIALYTRYIIAVLSVRRGRATRVLTFLNITVCSAGLLIWGVNCVFPFFFDILTRKPTNPVLCKVASLPGILPVLVNLVFIFCHSRRLARADAALLHALPLLPLASSLIGQIIPGLSLQYPLILASLILNHFYFDELQERELARQERELQEFRLRTTLERVKPHYIYNVLTSIYYLCENNAEKAQYTVGLFSDYLRDAMISMEQLKTVDFDDELKMVKNYLELEQVRFGDRIQVTYDIREKDFPILPFTVQPLVENAVKYGVQRQGGVHIRIESRRCGDVCLVTVTDDGPGFDPSKIASKSPSGLRNVQELLDLWHAGTLTIQSSPGQGTTAILRYYTPPRINIPSIPGRV